MAKSNEKAVPSRLAGPSWLNETPGEEAEYRLGVFINGWGEQVVCLTREEFVVLKVHLADERGLDTPALRSYLEKEHGYKFAK